jgi:class 3 adenylate cyclase/tetratricopeptide (TPR) repeat protein
VAAESPLPSHERRLVSVLFADLVGFTSLSEDRDYEDVRELLSDYFDACRSVVSRYGGRIEKFIGDAVMALWGAPVANEDDAERAVRAALELVEAVGELGGGLGKPELKVRAGVLTGEASVNLAASSDGLVVGDLVNTASRVESIAEPGSVYVGEATRRATEAAIAYENVGEHQLKGRTEPVRLHRAVRVVAGRAGLMKQQGLEPPFVGRVRELKLVKDLFHDSVEDGTAHLVHVTGTAGVGKSRLVWEFFKYMDGLERAFFWHSGRCLSYGEGVTYSAVSEMVRGRAGIVEGEGKEAAQAKLAEAVGRFVPDPEERRFVEPRLAHLLGLEDRQATDKADLFGGWRLFFERLASHDPVVMVFEDMQWADPSLLQFIDYLLDWSRNCPLFVMTLARPQAPGASAFAARNATSLYLEPLPDAAMEELLKGTVPGLPAELSERIRTRAEGVPLYAVETVRMLLDRSLLVRQGTVYRPTGTIQALAIPETLHALIAARLDSLDLEERRLLENASVLGKTFTVAAAAALTGVSGQGAESVLRGLVRKEVLSLIADPRSPERGQYSFLQDMVRTVTYATLPKRERKTKHLAAAGYLETSYRLEEIAEVLAAHYLDAYHELPEADDASAVKEKARLMLVRAGEHASSLAAHGDALGHFEKALELAESPNDRAEISEMAGRAAWLGGARQAARQRLENAVSAYEELDEPSRAASVRALLGEISWDEGRIEAGIADMERAYAELVALGATAGLAPLAAQLARLYFFVGGSEAARDYVEQALVLAERQHLPDVLSQALNTKALLLQMSGRWVETELLLRGALKIALEHDVPAAALRAYNNLGAVLGGLDRWQDALETTELSVSLARRVGDRRWEWGGTTTGIQHLVSLGRWDEALARADAFRAADGSEKSTYSFVELADAVFVLAQRGDLTGARSMFDEIRQAIGQSDDAQIRLACDYGQAVVLLAEGEYAGAQEIAGRALAAREQFGLMHGVKQSFVTAGEACLARGDGEALWRMLKALDEEGAGDSSPWLRAERARFEARLTALEGQSERAAAGLEHAARSLRPLRMPFRLAVVLLEHGELLASQGAGDEALRLLYQSGEIFTELKARPWLERIQAISPGRTAEEESVGAHSGA